MIYITKTWSTYMNTPHQNLYDCLAVGSRNTVCDATIDGRNMKYIIRKGTQEHDDIAKAGLASMTEEKKKELVNLFLLPKIDSDK